MPFLDRFCPDPFRIFSVFNGTDVLVRVACYLPVIYRKTISIVSTVDKIMQSIYTAIHGIFYQYVTVFFFNRSDKYIKFFTCFI